MKKYSFYSNILLKAINNLFFLIFIIYIFIDEKKYTSIYLYIDKNRK